MLRNIAGIMADEEPKTPTSASGLYNSSIFNVDAVFSSTILGGLSDFTIMNWFYISPPNPLDFYTQSYVEFGSSVNINPIRVFENKVDVSITNSSGGNIFITYPYTTPVDEWIHIAVTGSVTNNKVTLYINGVEVASTVMIYSIATGSTSGLMSDTSYASRAQLNIYNRELSEAEVAEHYVYDDDTMSSGVLGWDAMTPAQRSGLIYSSSYTDDISISGNEFNDKSGSGITISPQPSLTGQQIYFYTDASDLPSTTTIYDVNSATFNGTSQYFTYTNSPATGSSNSYNIWVKRNRLGINEGLFYESTSAGSTFTRLVVEIQSNNSIRVGFRNSPSGSFINIGEYGSINDNNWHMVTTVLENGSQRVYIDAVDVGGNTYGNMSLASPGSIRAIGANQITNPGFEKLLQGGIYNPEIFNYSLSPSQVATIYKGGTPVCYEERGIESNYSPRLGNWDTNAGDELVDQSTSGITTTPIGSPTYTDQGLQVECTN
jgi:hypothetical protein